MEDNFNIKPPRWADRFLEFYCKDSVLEDLQGDLYECFYDNIENKGIKKARIIFMVDVLKFIRPYTLRLPNPLERMRQLLIVKNYFKTSVRNFYHNWTFSLINVIGLAISISVGLLMITLLTEMKTYDNFHSKRERIFRINNSYTNVERNQDQDYASTSVLAGKKIQESVTGIEDVVLIRKHFTEIAGNDETQVPLEGLWASTDFFKVFDYKFLKGNPVTALKDPKSIVLTESMAKALFGDKDPLGAIVSMGDSWGDFTVTGIMSDPPMNSHLTFDALGSFITLDEMYKEKKSWLSWTSMWNNYVYMVIEKDASLMDIQYQLDGISEEENAKTEFSTITMSLQPLSDIAMGKDMSNQIGKLIDSKIVVMLAALTFVVLLSACFNYSNLSVARALRRSKEVGIRKVVGATKAQVFGQFVFESVFITIIAMLLALLIFQWLRPQFLSLDPYLQELVTLSVDFNIVFRFVTLAVITGIVAGFIPSLFFSKLNPNKVLKSNTSVQLFKGLTMRKALIILQFSLSIAFIMSAMLMNKQYRHALSFDLGYSTDNILNLKLLGNSPTTLINEINQLSEVENISSSLLVTSIGDTWGSRIKYKDETDSLIFHYNAIDNRYLELHNHKLIAGRNFNHTYLPSDSLPLEIIVDTEFLKYYSLDAQESLGEIFSISGREAHIVGVINSFQYTTIENTIRPFLFRSATEGEINCLNIKLNPENLFESRDKIEAIWSKYDDVQPIEATFYNESIEEIYNEYLIMVKIIGYLAFLAISIAILGLLGMVIFTTETRLKEISIRKVLGATDGNLVYLLGKGFMILLFISSIIAIPSTYYFMDEIIFSEMVNKPNFGFVEIMGGALLIFIVAIITISLHTFQAARKNPATTLRSE